MAYGSSDYAFEDAESMRKLDNMITEGKELLQTCKEYIECGEDSAFAEKLLFKAIADYIAKKV